MSLLKWDQDVPGPKRGRINSYRIRFRPLTAVVLWLHLFTAGCRVCPLLFPAPSNTRRVGLRGVVWLYGSGGWIRTNDLLLMRETSFRTAPPRDTQHYTLKNTDCQANTRKNARRDASVPVCRHKRSKLSFSSPRRGYPRLVGT